MKVFLTTVSVLALGLIAFLIWVTVQYYQDQEDYREWAEQCNVSGRVIVNVGPYDHCMTWEEAKERGVELEVG